MTTLETVKAWKDEDYRDTLTMEQLEWLPQHPSGLIELQQGGLEARKSFAAPDAEAKRTNKPALCTTIGQFCTAAPKACR